MAKRNADKAEALRVEEEVKQKKRDEEALKRQAVALKKREDVEAKLLAEKREKEEALEERLRIKAKADADRKMKREEEERRKERELLAEQVKIGASLAADVIEDVTLTLTARLEAEEDAKLKAEEDAKLKAEEDARLKAEEDAKLKAEEDARLKAEEDARLKAEEDARLKAEEDARLKAEEDARLKAEEDAKLKAEEDVRQQKEAIYAPADAQPELIETRDGEAKAIRFVADGSEFRISRYLSGAYPAVGEGVFDEVIVVHTHTKEGEFEMPLDISLVTRFLSQYDDITEKARSGASNGGKRSSKGFKAGRWNIFLNLRENKRGVFLKLATMLEDDVRRTITVPDVAWFDFRDAIERVGGASSRPA